MKIHSVTWNNYKKEFSFQTTRGEMELPYAKLRLKPEAESPIVHAYADPEIGKQGFTYQLADGREDTVPADALLECNGDLSYWRDMMLYKMTVEALELIKKKRISKRSLARRLGTSPAQLYRLLNTAFYGKTIDQMIRLLAALDCRVEMKFRQSA